MMNEWEMLNQVRPLVSRPMPQTTRSQLGRTLAHSDRRRLKPKVTSIARSGESLSSDPPEEDLTDGSTRSQAWVVFTQAWLTSNGSPLQKFSFPVRSTWCPTHTHVGT